MSLISFLRHKDVQERFRQEFHKPRFSVKRDILAPPLTSHYSLVGTAFHYLLGFYLQRLNPQAVAGRWVAESSIKRLLLREPDGVTINAQTGTVSYAHTKQTKEIQRTIEQAKELHSEYVSCGKMTDELLASTLLLGQLNPIVRAGFVPPDLGTVHKEDVADLRNLISIATPDLFRAQELCLLNPGFGEGSALVGGADGDLVIDDTIIDIKTTKNLELPRKYFDQVLGYYVLHEIAGVGGLHPKPEIAKVAIYFARHAYLCVFKLQEIIDPATFGDFVRWFIDRATKERGQQT